jgi:hypothetical protein
LSDGKLFNRSGENLLIHAGFGKGEVLGEVDAKNFVFGFVGADAEAMMEKAELFELFGVFDFTRGQLGDFSEGGGGEGVEADVFVESLSWGGIAVVGNLAAGEVQDKALVVTNEFGEMGIRSFVGVGDFFSERPYIAGVVIATLEKFEDHLFVNEGFIPLPINPNVGIDDVFLKEFDEALCSVGTAFRGHDVFSTETLDELGCLWGVDCEDNLVKEGNLAGAVPNPFEEGLIFEHGEHFSRETGRF